MTKLLIFDFDGVIISGSNEGYFICYHKALEAVGVKLEPRVEREKILEKWGKGYKLQIEYLLKDKPDLIFQAISEYEKCYYSPLFSAKIKMIEGVPSTLKSLSKKYTLAIVSGMMRETLEKYLGEYNISNFFDYILSSSDIEKAEDKKPSPHMLQMALEHFSVNKSDAVYIGDAKSDIDMARNAGIEPVVVLTGHLSEKEAKRLKVDKVIRDITFLDKALQ